MFGEVVPLLAKTRRVIAIDLQAHGRTADIDRPMSFEAMADDIAALIKHLGIEKADAMGYSLGGGVALRVAVQHPEAVRKLVLVSIAYKRDGWYPEILAGMAQVGAASAEPMKQTPMYQMYARIAPKPADGRCCPPKSATCSGRIMTGRKTCRESRRRHYCYLVMPTPSLPHMPCSSLNCLAAARRTAAGTDPECPTLGSPFCQG